MTSEKLIRKKQKFRPLLVGKNDVKFTFIYFNWAHKTREIISVLVHTRRKTFIFGLHLVHESRMHSIVLEIFRITSEPFMIYHSKYVCPKSSYQNQIFWKISNNALHVCECFKFHCKILETGDSTNFSVSWSCCFYIAVHYRIKSFVVQHNKRHFEKFLINYGAL